MLFLALPSFECGGVRGNLEISGSFSRKISGRNGLYMYGAHVWLLYLWGFSFGVRYFFVMLVDKWYSYKCVFC